MQDMGSKKMDKIFFRQLNVKLEKLTNILCGETVCYCQSYWIYIVKMTRKLISLYWMHVENIRKVGVVMILLLPLMLLQEP